MFALFFDFLLFPFVVCPISFSAVKISIRLFERRRKRGARSMEQGAWSKGHGARSPVGIENLSECCQAFIKVEWGDVIVSYVERPWYLGRTHNEDEDG